MIAVDANVPPSWPVMTAQHLDQPYQKCSKQVFVPNFWWPNPEETS